jgi:hypothetical protein
MAKVLVRQRAEGRFRHCWAEFEGERLSSYEDTRGEKNIVYALCRCTAYHYEAYRVHSPGPMPYASSGQYRGYTLFTDSWVKVHSSKCHALGELYQAFTPRVKGLSTCYAS